MTLAHDRCCDFCGGKSVTAYPAPRLEIAHTLTHIDGSRVEVASHQDAGSWLACRSCARLVDGERFNRLADRCARHADHLARGEVPVGVPRKVGKRFRSEAVASVRAMVAAFAAQRGAVAR